MGLAPRSGAPTSCRGWPRQSCVAEVMPILRVYRDVCLEGAAGHCNGVLPNECRTGVLALRTGVVVAPYTTTSERVVEGTEGAGTNPD